MSGKAKFKHTITVDASDIDQMNHVNNVVYLRYVQEVAESHWKHIADEALQREVLWVVLRHEIDYIKPAFEGEVLTGETWVEEPSGPKMGRRVALRNAKGAVLIEAFTMWCAINAETMRPMRVGEELYGRF